VSTEHTGRLPDQDLAFEQNVTTEDTIVQEAFLHVYFLFFVYSRVFFF